MVITMNIKNFVLATGTTERSGLRELRTVEKGRVDNRNQYCHNNGVLAAIDEACDVHVGQDTSENVAVLEALGFEPGSFYVPHSNDGGDYLRGQLQ
tara:strand:- start:321 stop:608 length:288 start_codon:yes stop_codon:yes gene_type:complete